MAGWSASEVGHQHYQHPRRDAQHFDAKLDSFSSLVIYLSLLSLAERPSLWQEHHDENLIFTKADFADPASSSLFKKIREIGPEHSRLADVLADAAIGQPAEVPSVLDLVKTKSGLPSWMTAPADIEATTKTREVARTEPALGPKTARWSPWQERTRGPSVPSTPASDTFQTLFGAPSPGAITPRDPSDVLGNIYFFSKEFVKKYFLIWYWATYIMLNFIGFDFVVSFVVALLCLTVGSVTYGLYKSIDEGVKARRARLSSSWHQTPTITAPPSGPGSWHPMVNLPPPSTSRGSSNPFVGNLVLGIYHLENCDWVERISSKNRVGFASASEAISHGFKPCRICSPATV